MTDRQWEKEVEYCEREGLAFIPWFPLSAGAVDHPVLHRVAARHGATVFQIALAWLLEHSPAMLVIPGTSSVEHLEKNVAAADTADEERHEGAGRPRPGRTAWVEPIAVENRSAARPRFDFKRLGY